MLYNQTNHLVLVVISSLYIGEALDKLVELQEASSSHEFDYNEPRKWAKWEFELGFSMADESCFEPFQGQPRLTLAPTMDNMGWIALGCPWNGSKQDSSAQEKRIEIPNKPKS